MEDLLEPFESIADATDKIDELIEQSEKLNRKEKKIKLQEAQALIDAVEKHCGRKMYKDLL